MPPDDKTLPPAWIDAIKEGAISASKRLRDGIALDDVISVATLEVLERAAEWPKGAADFYASHGLGFPANFARVAARRDGGAFQTKRADVEGAGWRDFASRRPIDIDAQIDVADAIDGLDDRSAALVIGWYWDNRTSAEMGAALGVTHARVSQIVRAALKELRIRLASYADEYDRGPRAARQRKTGTRGERSRTDFSQGSAPPQSEEKA